MRFNRKVPRRLKRLIGASLDDASRDYTKGNLHSAVLAASIPMVAEMILESVFALVNIFWIARFGHAAIAAVGVTEPVLSIVLSTAMGIGVATTAIVGRRVGEGDQKGAARGAAQAILVGITISPVLLLSGPVFARAIISVAQLGPGEITANLNYTSILLAGSPSLVLLTINNAIFRGIGRPAVAMRVLWFANVVNLVLDPLLIFGVRVFPGFGITGAAIATTLARSAAVAYQFWIFKKGVGDLRLRLATFSVDSRGMRILARASFTGVLQFYISDASWFALVLIIGRFGDVAVAGYTVAMRVVAFAILPSWGLGNAAAALVGQSLGAKCAARAQRAVGIVGLYNIVILAPLSVILVVFAYPISRLYARDVEITNFAGMDLKILGCALLCYGFSILMAEAFDGAGDTTTPTVVSLFAYWIVQVPVAFILAFPLHLGALGAIIMIPIAEIVYATVCYYIFRKGKWKRQGL